MTRTKPRARASFASRLKGLRGDAGLTQMELARKAGVTLSALHDWEQGRRQPSFAAACKLAGALGVTVAAFEK